MDFSPHLRIYNCTSDPNVVYNLSLLCIDNSLPVEIKSQLICFPEQFTDASSTIVGVWCVINSFIGFTGNLLTLCAIPYAAKNKWYGLERGWKTNTVFVLNLSFFEILYCTFNLTVYAATYLTRGWPFGYNLCIVSSAFIKMNAFGDWMSLGLIALSRCLSLTIPNLWRRFCCYRNVAIMFLLIWIYAFLMILPTIVVDYETFGFNCRQGKCGVIPIPGDEINESGPRWDIQIGIRTITFMIPALLIVVNYLIIGFYVHSSAKYLIRQGAPKTEGQKLVTSELRMTWTFLIIAVCYLLFTLPVTIADTIDPNAEHPWFVLTTYCLYWTQYSFNFLIYAARSDQYRKAYRDFLTMVWYKISHVGQEKLSKPAIVFVDKSLLPARLLEFYAQNNDNFNLDNSIKKINKSVWFDLPVNHLDGHLLDYGTTSIGDIGKCSGNYQMILPTFTDIPNMSANINLRMHIPRGNAAQCPLVIATSREYAAGRKTRRRSSDSRIKNFIEIGRHPINRDDEKVNYSKSKKKFESQKIPEHFSIAIDLNTVFTPKHEISYASQQMKHHRHCIEEYSTNRFKDNFSLALIASQNNFCSIFKKHHIRKNSF